LRWTYFQEDYQTITIDIASKLKGTGKAIGLDLSEKMIEQVKEKSPA
jgi:ubiquinone/menaquinone biosynthesis C-methylase UbiE